MGNPPSLGDIIKKIGGATALLKALQADGNKLTYFADNKWAAGKVPIPEIYWQKVCELGDVTINDIHAANMAVRTSRADRVGAQ